MDVPPEELETPLALPKPKASGESIIFNFTKMVSMNDKKLFRRERLVKALTASDEAIPGSNSASRESLSSVLPDHIIGFILVSEPEDAELDCEEVKFPNVTLIIRRGNALF